MRFALAAALGVFASLISAPAAAPAQAVEEMPRGIALRMVDPAIDEVGPFCYLAFPNGQLGVPGANRGAQVTFDGAVYTGGVEFVLLKGDSNEPICVRQKTLLEGCMPLIQMEWKVGPIEYRSEMFAFKLDDGDLQNPVNFVCVSAQNTSSETAPATISAATRFMAGDHRFAYYRQFAFSPKWQYEMTENAVYRDGKLIVAHSGGADREAVPGTVYTEPFSGDSHFLHEESLVGALRYRFDLKPGEIRDIEFRIPTLPPDRDAAAAALVLAADANKYREKFIADWRTRLTEGGSIRLPEEKVSSTWRATMAYLEQAIWTREGMPAQGVNKFQYRGFWLRDAAYMIHCYDAYGFRKTAGELLALYPEFQQEDGLFQSQAGQLDGFGQALYALAQHAFLTGDVEYARRVYPMYPPAVEWLKKARAADPLGIMPGTEVADNELISGHYTGHNFWALLGLRSAIRMARLTGHDKDAANFEAEYKLYRQHFLELLDKRTKETGGYIPPGMDTDGGQDWGNLIGVFPSEVLSLFDSRTRTTTRRMHDIKFREGAMTYRYGIHQYLTVMEAQNHVYTGEDEQAVKDLYGILLHSGSMNEVFEWQAIPWGDRDVDNNFPPHGWGASMVNLLLRNMLIHESGGNGGLDGRSIDLFSAISPAWARPGDEIELVNMPTEIGAVSATYRFLEDGAEITIDPEFREQPISIGLRFPWFVEPQSVEADSSFIRSGHAVSLGPDARKVRLHWTRHVDETPLSYEQTVADYKAEYARRYAIYIQQGGAPRPIVAPVSATGEAQKAEFLARYGAQKPGIAVGKPVTVSSPSEDEHTPDRAVDGDAADQFASSWWVGPPAPQWLQVDLGTNRPVNGLHVYPYWDGYRYYQYQVEGSGDGEHWTMLADKSKNEKPATGFGDRFAFEPVSARYIRITMLFNSANTSMHLVELKVFSADEPEAGP